MNGRESMRHFEWKFPSIFRSDRMKVGNELNIINVLHKYKILLE